MRCDIQGGCSVGFGILLLSLFSMVSTSSYQWRCSQLDTDINKYYLPDFGGRTQVLGYTWQTSMDGATYIYDVDDNSLGCSGTVTAVEFCFTPPSSNKPSLREVFTLLTLRQQNNVIIVTDSIPISFRPSSAECTSSKCCEVMTLMEQDQFDLPASNFLIGMTTKTSPNLPGLHFNTYASLQTGSSYQLSIGQPTINSMYTLTGAIEQSLRLMWFHITPFPETTTTPSMQQTTPSTTPALVSSSGDMTSANTYTSTPPSTSSAIATPEDTPSNDMTSANTRTSVPPTTLTDSPDSDESSSNIRTDANTPSMSSSASRISSEVTTPFSSARVIPGPSARSSSNISAIGGVIGAVVVLILVIISVLLVLVLFMLYRRKKHQSAKDMGEIAIDNIIYNSNNIKSPVAMRDPSLSNPEYDYSEVGPSVVADVKGTLSSKLENYYSPVLLEDNNIIPQEYEDVEHKTEGMSLQPDYDDIYTVPANDVVGLYEQLETMMTDNVTKHNIVLGDLLGSGQFGDVYKGIWERRLDNMDVAVKALKEGSSEDDKVKFLQEAAIMAQFRHPNVVTMYGVVKDGEPILLVLEMLKKGDLRNYLLSMKTDDGGVSHDLDGHELLSYCRQVASGMVYLSNKAFVHRDLAARNILVSDDRICKIADFGMSRDLEDENYYVSHGGKIPVKWTAPEALFYKKYSTASDVWSFGAVMYEIWSIGHKPFENMQNSQVIKMLNSGNRLPPPPGCPRAIYSIMMSCWHPEVNGRPNFNELSTKLSVSNSKLLHDDKRDTTASSMLGADLSHGEEMYENLQKMYSKSE